MKRKDREKAEALRLQMLTCPEGGLVFLGTGVEASQEEPEAAQNEAEPDADAASFGSTAEEGADPGDSQPLPEADPAPEPEPTAVHAQLARQQAKGKLRAVITFDDDGLFSQAGVEDVIVLSRDKAALHADAVQEALFDHALQAVEAADMLIVSGLDLRTKVQEQLVERFNGKRLVIIGEKETPYDLVATPRIRANAPEVFASR